MSNNPEVSPAIPAEEMVKAVYPDAAIVKVIYNVEVFQVRSVSAGLILGEGDNEELAWIDAASRFPTKE